MRRDVSPLFFVNFQFSFCDCSHLIHEFEFEEKRQDEILTASLFLVS